jgi:hypothetical protein
MAAVDPQTLAMMRTAVQGYFLTPVLIQDQVETLDAYGKASLAYVTAGSARGQVSGVSGAYRSIRDQLATAGRLKTRTALLSLTWGTAVQVGQVASIGGTRWDVVHVDDVSTLAAQVTAMITTADLEAGDRSNVE